MSTAPSAPWSCILLDLDGTIADSAPGIIGSLEHMFRELGREVPSRESLLRWVGPPLLDAFRDFAGMTPAEAAEALIVYRRHYLDQGAAESVMFEGMPAVFHAIREEGVPLSLATSKPELPASIIVEKFGLADYFTVLAGASADEVRSAKADVIEEALRRLSDLGVDLSNPVMVGDRKHDAEGAAAHGIPTIMVGWGYGPEEERALASAFAETPADLIGLLFPHRAAAAAA